MALSKEDLIKMLYWMVLDRRFEERMMLLHRAGRIRGHLHPGLGQEATNVGVAYGLRPEDCLTLAHRGKTPELIKGWSMKDMVPREDVQEGSLRGRAAPRRLAYVHGDLSKRDYPQPGDHRFNHTGRCRPWSGAKNEEERRCCHDSLSGMGPPTGGIFMRGSILRLH